MLDGLVFKGQYPNFTADFGNVLAYRLKTGERLAFLPFLGMESDGVGWSRMELGGAGQ